MSSSQPPSAVADSYGREERIGHSATFALLAQLVGALLTAVLTIFLGRVLSPRQYGAFTFALSVIAIATLLADVGVTSSAVRYLAERRSDRLAAAAVFRTALKLKLRIGVPASLGLLALSGPICDAFGTPAAVWPLRGCALALLAQEIFLLFLGAFIALGRVRYNLVLATIESVVETVASIALVLAGAAATGAAFGRAIGYAAGLGAGVVVVGRVIGGGRGGGRAGRERERRGREDEPADVPARQIMSYAGPLFLVDAAFRVFSSIDVLLIAALLGGGAKLAAFALPMRLAVFLEYPSAAVTSAVAPRLAARGEIARGGLSLLAQSMRYLTILQMLFAVPAAIWPEAIMHLLFGDKYPEAASVLRALAPYIFISGLAQLTTLSVNYLGEARRRVPIAVAMLSLNVALDVLLLPRIGVVGGAIGTSAAYALWVPAHIAILRRRVGLPLRPLLVTALRVCLAGAAMAAALALIGSGRVPLPAMLLGAVVGPAVYVLALLVLGELSSRDAALVRRLLVGGRSGS